MSNQMIDSGECMHVRWPEQTWQNQSHYAKQGRMINQHNQHTNVSNTSQTNIAMKHRNNSYLGIPNQNNRPSQSTCQVSQTDIAMKHRKSHYIKSLDQDNQSPESVHQYLKWIQWPIMHPITSWNTQMPHLLHFKFKLDPLKIPSGVAILWTPHFGSCVSHSMASSIFILKNWFYLIKKIDLESPLIFVLFLKW